MPLRAPVPSGKCPVHLVVALLPLIAACGMAGCVSPDREAADTTSDETYEASAPRTSRVVERFAESGHTGPPPPRFESFRIEDGLASNQVNAILQDRQGFLWVGTWGGLNRFDGASFSSFPYDPATQSPAPPDVYSLFEDRGVCGFGKGFLQRVSQTGGGEERRGRLEGLGEHTDD